MGCIDTILKWIYGDGVWQGCPRCPFITIFIAFVFTAIGYGLSFAASKGAIPALYDLFGIAMFTLGFTIGLVFAGIACFGAASYAPTYQRVSFEERLVQRLDGANQPRHANVGHSSLGSMSPLIHSDSPLENMDSDEGWRENNLSVSDEQTKPPAASLPVSTSSSDFQVLGETGKSFADYGQFHQCLEEKTSRSNSSISANRIVEHGAHNSQEKTDVEPAAFVTQATSAVEDIHPNQNDKDDSK